MWWIKSIHYLPSTTKIYCKIGCFTIFIQNKYSYVKSLQVKVMKKEKKKRKEKKLSFVANYAIRVRLLINKLM